MKNVDASTLANKRVSLEANTGKTTHIFMSMEKNTEKTECKLFNKSFLNIARGSGWGQVAGTFE